MASETNSNHGAPLPPYACLALAMYQRQRQRRMKLQLKGDEIIDIRRISNVKRIMSIEINAPSFRANAISGNRPRPSIKMKIAYVSNAP